MKTEYIAIRACFHRLTRYELGDEYFPTPDELQQLEAYANNKGPKPVWTDHFAPERVTSEESDDEAEFEYRPPQIFTKANISPAPLAEKTKPEPVMVKADNENPKAFSPQTALDGPQASDEAIPAANTKTDPEPSSRTTGGKGKRPRLSLPRRRKAGAHKTGEATGRKI